MTADSKALWVHDLDRISLRLLAETFQDMDGCRAARPGWVWSNSWITEAVQEKLARDLGRRRHG